MHLHVCVYVPLHTHGEATGRCQMSSFIVPFHIPLRENLPVIRKLTVWASLEFLGCHRLCSPMLGLQASIAMLSFLHRYWRLNLRSSCFHSNCYYPLIYWLSPYILICLFMVKRSNLLFCFYYLIIC